ncbi:MAG TPA: hypothetical protein VGH98_18865 [Gemmatimonadaceae bacterium]|jgi:hypothetical protein
MDDRTHRDRDTAPPNRSAPSGPNPEDDSYRNGRHSSSGGERTSTDRSSSGKPALTDRERRERWPVD